MASIRKRPVRGAAQDSGDDPQTALSLTVKAYERIRGDVLSCRLVPGEWLNIAELSKRLPASLGAVREALSRLTSEGLVEAEPRRGFRVTPLSEADLRDLTNLRVEIEGLCLRQSIEKGDVSWESGVVAAYHRLSRIGLVRADDPMRVSDDWIDAHRVFHEALVAACDSPWMMRVRRMLYAQSERYRQLSLPLQQGPRDLDREHKAIMKAAIDRDAERAVASMTKHQQATMSVLLKAIEKRAQPMRKG